MSSTPHQILAQHSRENSDSSEGELQQSFEHPESEIYEEDFTPDIEEVDQLREIVRRRTLLRDAPYREEADEEEGDTSHISREQIQARYNQLIRDNDTSPVMEAKIESKVTEAHDYINQAVVDMVLDEDEQGKNGEDACKSNGKPSYSRKSSEQRKQPVAMPEQGEFEKRLLLAKSKSKANNMPDIFQIPWYHPGISRHIAECLLVYEDIQDGTFLLRDCVADPNTVTLSVRCQKSVKHYKVAWDGKQFLFGLGKFNTLDEFKEHFMHQPVISGDSGVLVQLRYPYPRGVSEPAIYHEANVLTDVDSTNIETKKKSNSKSNLKPNKAAKFISSLDLSINSKEGYLTKMGFHRKNWKKRWFVLYKNELKYFNCCGDKEPLKVIQLEEVTSIDRDDSVGKSNCFRLVTPNRTFFMYAGSQVEAIEWVQILDWKLKQMHSSSKQ